jgi:drug/metabolite transporter (DMT)-like permease
MRRAFFQLHISVLLAGFTGVLGRLITLNEGLLVWYRLLITSLTLWALALLSKSNLRISKRDLIKITGVGSIAALHWVTFYGSIKYANVSVALVCFSAIGFFTALIEPLAGKKFSVLEFVLGLMNIAGIYLIFHFDPAYQTGIVIGIVSALLAAIFPVMNKALLKTHTVEKITLYELTGGFVVLTALMPFYLSYFPVENVFPAATDWLWLLILSWLCTVLAFRLSMNALKKISAFTVNLSFTLEPLYGIALAFLLFREHKDVSWSFYLGLAMIVLGVGLQTLMVYMRQVKSEK